MFFSPGYKRGHRGPEGRWDFPRPSWDAGLGFEPSSAPACRLRPPTVNIRAVTHPPYLVSSWSRFSGMSPSVISCAGEGCRWGAEEGVIIPVSSAGETEAQGRKRATCPVGTSGLDSLLPSAASPFFPAPDQSPKPPVPPLPAPPPPTPWFPPWGERGGQ